MASVQAVAIRYWLTYLKHRIHQPLFSTTLFVQVIQYYFLSYQLQVLHIPGVDQATLDLVFQTLSILQAVLTVDYTRCLQRPMDA